VASHAPTAPEVVLTCMTSGSSGLENKSKDLRLNTMASVEVPCARYVVNCAALQRGSWCGSVVSAADCSSAGHRFKSGHQLFCFLGFQQTLPSVLPACYIARCDGEYVFAWGQTAGLKTGTRHHHNLKDLVLHIAQMCGLSRLLPVTPKW
jgi:hypothetical protein